MKTIRERGYKMLKDKLTNLVKTSSEVINKEIKKPEQDKNKPSK